jgi:hypothetical protein
MATTYYASIDTYAGEIFDVDHAGTASTAGDNIELRMGNGTYSPDRREVLLALKRFERWIIQGGLDQAGANLPVPTGTV